MHYSGALSSPRFWPLVFQIAIAIRKALVALHGLSLGLGLSDLSLWGIYSA